MASDRTNHDQHYFLHNLRMCGGNTRNIYSSDCAGVPMTLPISERVKAALAFSGKDLVRAPAEIVGITDLAEYINARNAALHSALVQAVRVMENNSCGKEYYERNRRLGLPLGPTEEAYEQTAAIEKVLGEK